jgi:hypothetical protein
MAGRIKLVVFRGQRFAYAVVIDPEMRAGRRDNKPQGYRCALLECRCGTVYMAQISHLYAGKSHQCPDCARREVYRARRKVGGLVSRNGDAWTVNVYVGRYPTRAEAEKVAARSRVLLLPERDSKIAAAAAGGPS